MNAAQLEHWILNTYTGIVVKQAYRERSFFYNPELSLPNGIYMATVKDADGPNDKASDLDREGVFRLSIGIGKKQYIKLFGPTPVRPEKGGIVSVGVDFKVLNIVMPHPIYAWMGWVCINNPRISNETVKFFLDIAYDQVVLKYQNKKLPL